MAAFTQGSQQKHHSRIQCHLTLADIKGELKTWDENTATSPISGMHLGLWKTVFCPHLHSKDGDELKEECDRKQRKAQTAWLNLINWAPQHNCTYDRWKEIVTQMTLKKTGDCRIHRLRVTHLHKADYNPMLGVFWRETLHQAEDLTTINEGLYGGRPGQNAHVPVFVENMENKIFRMSGKHLIKFDNDAASCYDGISVLVGSLASRAFGMPRNVTVVWASTLEEAKCKLKMNSSISEEWCQHSQTHPIHGSGQGCVAIS